MKVFGIAGHSGMGKTTLLERLIPELTSRGLTVSLIKHSHKDIELDKPGKDSHRLRESGCHDVALVGRNRWAVMHELKESPEPRLGELLRHIRPCDLVLIEGFKSGRFPRLEVWRSAVGMPSLWPDTADIVATVGDAVPRVAGSTPPPCLEFADIARLANVVERHAVRARLLPWHAAMMTARRFGAAVGRRLGRSQRATTESTCRA